MPSSIFGARQHVVGLIRKIWGVFPGECLYCHMQDQSRLPRHSLLGAMMCGYFADDEPAVSLGVDDYAERAAYIDQLGGTHPGVKSTFTSIGIASNDLIWTPQEGLLRPTAEKCRKALSDASDFTGEDYRSRGDNILIEWPEEFWREAHGVLFAKDKRFGDGGVAAGLEPAGIITLIVNPLSPMVAPGQPPVVQISHFLVANHNVNGQDTPTAWAVSSQTFVTNKALEIQSQIIKQMGKQVPQEVIRSIWQLTRLGLLVGSATEMPVPRPEVPEPEGQIPVASVVPPAGPAVPSGPASVACKAKADKEIPEAYPILFLGPSEALPEAEPVE